MRDKRPVESSAELGRLIRSELSSLRVDILELMRAANGFMDAMSNEVPGPAEKKLIYQIERIRRRIADADIK